MTNDSDARAARAARLRDEIEKLTKAGSKKKDKAAAEPAAEPEGTESPRDFIQRRMRELDGKGGE